MIVVDDHWHGVNFGHIKGKHRRLDAMLNDIAEGADGYMTVSPQTARAVETRFRDADDEQSEWDDGLWDEDEPADNAWDLLILSLRVRPKRQRLQIAGVALFLVLTTSVDPAPARFTASAASLSSKGCRACSYAWHVHRLRVRYSQWRPAAPFASADAGSGPLGDGDLVRSRIEVARDVGGAGPPVVDTDGYLPGRSPYQRLLAQRGVRNSDITVVARDLGP